MVEFSLPANSKVTTGITYKAKEPRESPKNLVIYRWNPEEKKNPRLDTYEIDQSKCCLLYTSPSPRDKMQSPKPSYA